MDIRIAVISLWAENVPAAAHFYREVVGLPLLAHFEGDRPHFDLGGPILTIIRGRPACLAAGSGAAFPGGSLLHTRPGCRHGKTANS